MNRNPFKKKFFYIILLFGLIFVCGCAVQVSGEVPTSTPVAESTLSPTVPPEIMNPTEAPTPTFTSTPTPTNTPLPTATPTPTSTPTPTEIPVYDQILMLEKENREKSKIPVKAALLVNLSENRVLYSDHATDVIYPASITKLMTAYVVFSQKEDLTETVKISKTAVTPVIPSAKMCGFRAGDRILLKDLLGCMLVYSGNDTSVAVAEHISGSESEFVKLMNQKADEIGLRSSVFYNSHGLPNDNHVTSAYDIYLIMQKLFNFEEFLGIIDSGSIEVDVLRNESVVTFDFTSTNQFLWGTYKLPEGITLLGGKTGTTNKAGCCLTLYVQDSNSNCYIAEIFGAESYETLYPCMIQLLEYISEE